MTNRNIYKLGGIFFVMENKQIRYLNGRLCFESLQRTLSEKGMEFQPEMSYQVRTPSFDCPVRGSRLVEVLNQLPEIRGDIIGPLEFGFYPRK